MIINYDLTDKIILEEVKDAKKRLKYENLKFLAWSINVNQESGKVVLRIYHNKGFYNIAI